MARSGRSVRDTAEGLVLSPPILASEGSWESQMGNLRLSPSHTTSTEGRNVRWMRHTLLASLTAALIPFPGMAIGGQATVDVLAGDWTTVISKVEKQEGEGPEPVSQLLLGHAYLATNQNTRAFQEFISVDQEGLSKWVSWTQSLLEANGQEVVALYLAGDAMARIGVSERAIHYFSRALSQDEDFHLARNARGLTHLSRNDLDSAEVDFYLATQQAPDFADAWANYGNVAVLREVSLSQSDMTLGFIEKALEIDPGFALAHNARGCLYFGNGDFDEATADFQVAAQLDPGLLIAEINQAWVASYVPLLARLTKDGVGPGTSFDSIVDSQKTAVQQQRIESTDTQSNRDFMRDVRAIPYMDRQDQQAVIDRYGFQRVRSAVEMNIAGRKVAALEINRESQRFRGRQELLGKLELGFALAKFGQTMWSLGANAAKLGGVGVPEAARGATRQEAARSLQETAEKQVVSSMTKSRTLQTVIDAAQPNPAASIASSAANTADSVVTDQREGLRSLEMQANLRVVELARANRADWQFLRSHTETGSVIGTSLPTQVRAPVSRTPTFQPPPSVSSVQIRSSQFGHIQGRIDVPGGVSTKELARSFVDDGDWPVVTAFTLSYPAVVVQDR